MRQEDKDRLATWMAAFAIVTIFFSIVYAAIVGC